MKTNFRKPTTIFSGRSLERGAAWGMMIIAALLAFEIFNFSSTAFALEDVLGNLRFMGVQWATILAIAFCGIDFAGVARLFTPEQGADEPAEVWYLFGAWLLAAVMNAMLTWWGVSVAIAQNGHLGSGVINSATTLKVVPIFVAIMVWLIRVLIIGTFSVAGERLFSQDTRKKNYTNNRRASTHYNRQQPAPRTASPRRPAQKPASRPQPTFSAEPTYHNLSASGAKRQKSFDSREKSYRKREF